MVTPETRDIVARSEDAAYRVVDGCAVIVTSRNGRVVRLNRIGTRVWEMLGDRNLEQLAMELDGAFSIGAERALRDVTSFIEALQVRGLAVVKRSR
ncbi:MAG: PqqD family protein [Acidobacteriota bacterium]